MTEPPVGLRARRLGWSREAAAPALVARHAVTPFGSLPHVPPARVRCLTFLQGKRDLTPFADKRAGKALPHRPRQRTRRASEPRFDARPPRFRVAGGDLTAIEGIDENTALVLLSEIGTDMSRWPTEKHFAAWLGLGPPHTISGGKVLSRKVRPSANRAATALRLAAPCLPHSPSALGAFCRRLKARLGAPKAITATAHKLARLVYRRLKYGEDYVAQGMAEYEQAYRERTVQNLLRKAKALGDKLPPLTEGTAQTPAV
ncbi:MAG: IS110 family transposase [Deltaproteobacteria bacterium]|nr:IS110 family transposase [Deltaproteobacteria bacterium]